MKIDKKIIDRFEDLRELGEKVKATKQAPNIGHITSSFVDVQLATQWLTSCSSLFERVFGNPSVHYKSLQQQFKDYPKWPNVEAAFGVLLAAIDDYHSGALFDVKQLIEAKLFDNFLEQAEHLTASGYYHAGAVIAGSVLEDGLRKICIKNSIHLTSNPKLDWMNSECAKHKIYNKLTQKKITAIADLRNSAAHGKWNKFDKKNVEDMLRDVRDFMEKNYA